MRLPIAKRIADPVHGTIPLTATEIEVIDTPVFQRLHDVKQLSLADKVFPGASYSRFSHSLGVCHVMGRVAEALGVDGAELQALRLAALLHDVGHYPFSHVMEGPIRNYQSETSFTVPADEEAADSEGGLPRILSHEGIRDEMLLRNEALRGAIGDEMVERLVQLYSGGAPFAGLVSADLDVDRIDFLLRNAHHTGLPYGSIDLDYLVSQITRDNEGGVCFRPSALRTAEHLLLARLFDYRQVIFHKTVAGLELLLKDVLAALIEADLIAGSVDDLLQMLTDGSWSAYHDPAVWAVIRSVADGHQVVDNAEVVRTKARAVLDRRPPVLAAEAEFFGKRKEVKTYNHYRKRAEDAKLEWARATEIPVEYWHVWSRSPTITELGSVVEVSQARALQEDVIDHSVRLRCRDGSSKALTEVDQSLVKVLSDYALFDVRVYALIPPGHSASKERIRDVVSGSDLWPDHHEAL